MQDLDPLLEIFVQEGAEKIEALDALLLELERDPQAQGPLTQAMRAAHSLKGAAGAAGVRHMAELVHAFEGVLQLLKLGRVAAGASIFDDLFQTVDELRREIEGASEPGLIPPTHAGVMARLTAWLGEEGGGVAGATAAEAGSAFRLGEYDLARIRALQRKEMRLFQVDVLLTSAREGSTPVAALAVLRACRTAGDVVATVPPEPELEHCAAGQRLRLLVGAREEADVEQGLRDLDLAEVRVRPYTPPLPAGGAPGAVAGSVRSDGATKPWIKLDLERVDALIEMIGELVITESMVVSGLQGHARGDGGLRNTLNQMTRITRALQDEGMRLRMVSLRGLFQAMSRLVRDLARQSGKDIHLAVSGETVEIDRSLVERLRDPLVHLIRNAVDHGVDTAAERRARGKRATATITLSAAHRGGNIVIQVSDDGNGLDRRALLQRGRAEGFVPEGSTPAEPELLDLLFEPGFTTRTQVTELSGRGVGLSAVRQSVEAMRGRVSVGSTLGHGTTIEMTLPLTLAIIEGMLTAVGPERFILPTLSVVETVQAAPSMIATHRHRLEYLRVREELVPLLRLERLFGQEGVAQGGGLAVIVESASRKTALLVDDVIAQQQVVIKSLGAGLGQTPLLSGAAILPDGQVGLILNVDAIVNLAGRALSDAVPSTGTGAVAYHQPRRPGEGVEVPHDRDG